MLVLMIEHEFSFPNAHFTLFAPLTDPPVLGLQVHSTVSPTQLQQAIDRLRGPNDR